ncbi:uncharacterized protein [Oryza sativa Japonica Group]|uniref:Expressed protein n=2 Tax=Oryza sativa subsp. japonica TaxID=39947 RepID=Q10NA8_ORYSJ|nr:uncharacterized protein LOC4332414 [Oryza sativa Japonica Group]ABF95259.1 expressed protein [Oryza sativa Japonica Group]EEE58793.1 hypothetical protein OsJ_10330 [Oryza sativa Japonica Group]KAF2938587.1 hypothetical protein DAI22_03g128900 [Oryza sativa Japonica Group]BAF11627.1 Os03g0276600 [Oryza sativa Japonica Group]BAG89970.1 unnamed protein product [Oryza sativa Japonica Group]|eukprot:NP_001049713.1 Os03g0276600 [Oryza sativa Japonica Group]
MAMAKAKLISLSFADKCRNILCANWEAHLNTIKADIKGSKGEIYTSRVHYMVERGTTYLIVPEDDRHTINIVIDERGSLSVCSPIPGRLTTLLRSLGKLPPRIAMTGDVLFMKRSKVPVIADSLKKAILKEHKAASEASHSVSAILSSASAACRSRSEGLLSLLDQGSSYNILKFEIGSCVYIDSLGSSHKVDLDNFEPPKADLLLPFSARIIDGINRSDPRRRALIFFCFEYFNVTATDALLLSIDHHGFDVLAKVPEKAVLLDVPRQYVWREFRFSFKEAAKDIEDFCRMLVELEEEALQSMKSYSGL